MKMPKRDCFCGLVCTIVLLESWAYRNECRLLEDCLQVRQRGLWAFELCPELLDFSDCESGLYTMTGNYQTELVHCYASDVHVGFEQHGAALGKCVVSQY